jgi:uncharacterized MnhB-related membrane protein
MIWNNVVEVMKMLNNIFDYVSNMELIDYVMTVVSIFLVVLAILAINAKTLIKSVMFLSGLSMLSVIGFVLMKAPDVAVTEAVIGSGLVTSLFVFTLLSVKKVGAK